MRKQSLFTVLMFVAFSLAVLMAAYSATRSNTNDICQAAEEKTEEVENLGGKMLWESLSSQFVSSVKY